MYVPEFDNIANIDFLIDFRPLELSMFRSFYYFVNLS